MKISSLAGKPAPPAMLVDVPRLITAYYTEAPDSTVPAQRVAFGTSGHRGSSGLQVNVREAGCVRIAE
jgi:phosphoglucomutase